MARIHEVAVRGVRGVREEVRLDLDGRSLLLHGDNGTGKSSIERALRWALLGEEEPSGAPSHTTEDSYRRNLGVKPGYPRVSITFDDDSSITVTPGNVTTTGNGAAIRVACGQGWPFLRRSELLDVLTLRPVDRFQYFESFLGLDKVDELITELATLRAAGENRKGQLTSRIAGAMAPLAALLPSDALAPSSVGDLQLLATERVRSLKLAEDGDAFETIAGKVQRLSEATATGVALRQRADLERVVTKSVALQARFDVVSEFDIDELAAERRELLSTLAGASEANLVEHALAHFAHNDGDVCPVCGQNVQWSNVRDGLQKRAESLSRLSALQSRIREAVEDARNRIGDLGRLGSDLLVALGHAGKPGDIYASFSTVTALMGAPWTDADAAFAAVCAAGGTTGIRECARAAEHVGLEARRALTGLPTPEQVPEVKALAALFEKLVILAPQLKLVELELASISHEVALQTEVLNALRIARQDVARDTLSAIQGSVAQNYAAIHPPGTQEDRTGAPSIDVQRHGKGSAFVRGAFDGKEVKDPQWVYSDGHLDTVGICIFLALRRHRAATTGDPLIMVLDDIIVSIDLSHARRLIDLLKNEFADHQVLILTHNGLFAHWCKSLMPGLKRMEIKEWTLESGPRIGDYTTTRERLDGAIESGTAKEIAGALMQFLDEWTAEARYAYSVAVPAKVGEQYTLTDIWEPLAARFKKMAKHMKTDLGGVPELLERLRDVPAVRNHLGAHENQFAKEYPRSVMVEIAGATRQLIDALYCAECQAFVAPMPHASAPELLTCPKRHTQYIAKP